MLLATGLHSKSSSGEGVLEYFLWSRCEPHRKKSWAHLTAIPEDSLGRQSFSRSQRGLERSRKCPAGTGRDLLIKRTSGERCPGSWWVHTHMCMRACTHTHTHTHTHRGRRERKRGKDREQKRKGAISEEKVSFQINVKVKSTELALQDNSRKQRGFLLWGFPSVFSSPELQPCRFRMPG